MLAAFDALSAFPGFPYALVATWSIVRRSRHGLNLRVLRIANDVRGPKRLDKTAAETDG